MLYVTIMVEGKSARRNLSEEGNNSGATKGGGVPKNGGKSAGGLYRGRNELYIEKQRSFKCCHCWEIVWL